MLKNQKNRMVSLGIIFGMMFIVILTACSVDLRIGSLSKKLVDNTTGDNQAIQKSQTFIQISTATVFTNNTNVFVLQGTANSSNSVNRVDIKVGTNEFTAVNGTSNWNYQLDASILNNPEMRYITIRAINSSGQTNTIQISISAPDAAINQAANFILQTNVILKTNTSIVIETNFTSFVLTNIIFLTNYEIIQKTNYVESILYFTNFFVLTNTMQQTYTTNIFNISYSNIITTEVLYLTNTVYLTNKVLRTVVLTNTLDKTNYYYSDKNNNGAVY